MKLFLRGPVPSKKNEYRRKRNGGMYRPAAVVSEIDALIMQARLQWRGLRPLEKASVHMDFVVKDGRSDLDNKFVCLGDALVKAGVLRNDSISRISRISANAEIDPSAEESVTVTLS